MPASPTTLATRVTRLTQSTLTSVNRLLADLPPDHDDKHWLRAMRNLLERHETMANHRLPPDRSAQAAK